jgi:predicted nucleotidyltransferase
MNGYQQIANEIEIITNRVLSVMPDTETIYLFGSHAYGIPREDSDIDIYVVIPDSVQRNPLEVSADIRMKLPRGFRFPLDLLVGKSSVFLRRSQGATLQKVIAESGVKLYER